MFVPPNGAILKQLSPEATAFLLSHADNYLGPSLIVGKDRKCIVDNLAVFTDRLAVNYTLVDNPSEKMEHNSVSSAELKVFSVLRLAHGTKLKNNNFVIKLFC